MLIRHNPLTKNVVPLPELFIRISRLSSDCKNLFAHSRTESNSSRSSLYTKT